MCYSSKENSIFAALEIVVSTYRMKILHLSDTHGHHRELEALPLADVVVHSGDITYHGTYDEVIDFVDWFSRLPFEYKVFIAGNHDFALAGEKGNGIDVCERINALLPEHTYYLCHSGVTIQGIHFYGVPMFRATIDDTSYEKFYPAIPHNTDVLVTHQPPMGILDGGEYQGKPHHYGNSLLLERVRVVSPKLHLFGHDHNVFGTTIADGICFSNGALTGHGCELIRSPKVIELNFTPYYNGDCGGLEKK
jgi:predicted phosphodiesterase